ncbi:hypothetical protein VTI74DRAFT_3751 [Chaetomium olivicolor]
MAPSTIRNRLTRGWRSTALPSPVRGRLKFPAVAHVVRHADLHRRSASVLGLTPYIQLSQSKYSVLHPHFSSLL